MQEAVNGCPFPPHHPQQIEWLRQRALRGEALIRPTDAPLDDKEGFVPHPLLQRHEQHGNGGVIGLARWDGEVWRVFAKRKIRRKRKKGQRYPLTPEQLEKARLASAERRKRQKEQRQQENRPEKRFSKAEAQRLRESIFQNGEKS